jgi:beta-mannan synthase
MELEAAVWACLAMSVMLVLEVCYMSVASFVAVNLLCRTPERRYSWEPMPSGSGIARGDDEEAAVGGGGGEAYPMVLVQIPMYNEREVRPRPRDSHVNNTVGCWRYKCLLSIS